jgi:hypothetical protein
MVSGIPRSATASGVGAGWSNQGGRINNAVVTEIGRVITGMA